MNIIPEDVFKQRRIRRIIENSPADPVINLILARIEGAEDRDLSVEWESLTAGQQELYVKGFWDGLPILKRILLEELKQWQPILEAYLWWRGDLM